MPFVNTASLQGSLINFQTNVCHNIKTSRMQVVRLDSPFAENLGYIQSVSYQSPSGLCDLVICSEYLVSSVRVGLHALRQLRR